MGKILRTAAVVSSFALLAACGQQPPGYTNLFGHVAEGFPAESVMNDARATQPSGSAYHQALYSELMEHAEYEYGQMQDYRDAMWHARNAMTAAGGSDVEPAQIGSRRLPADKVDELTSARNRLVAALAAGAPQAKPEPAARAVAKFNCWIEQQEENFQPKDIAYCRDAFFAALEEIEVKKVAAPEVITLQSDVFFDFDKATIKPAFFPELDKVAKMLVENTNMRLFIAGHTDTAGPKSYNQGLSERRGNAVADYLGRKGVSADRLTVQGFGETQLAVPTPDNTPNAQNRRVEIRQR
ncbi:OmpA family protein [Geminicoccaceae bacterium 1502E]|uniref:OmpA family protein n=1 Tax=Marinimicrococcus flavescens TaxID=3031815 RepID=A0AAP3UYR1_9PROT|nr:OmpA family protein [Marinimicrococcus flavescens]MDX6752209.1 OmpA family protein [Geminicoccaceae bacterium 1502E]